MNTPRLLLQRQVRDRSPPGRQRAAVVATIATLGALDRDPRGPFVPPTINLEVPDPECDLDYTPRRASGTDQTVALVNCLAFGAKNSAITLRVLG